MKYNKNLFEQGNNVIIADEVEEGMIICLSKCRYFYVNDIDKEFINDDVSDLYCKNCDSDNGDSCPPEHTVITFIDELLNEITNIPGTATVIAYKGIKGKHSGIRK